MRFRFDVNLSDADYFEFNRIWALKTPYGKKQILTLRIMVLAIFGFFTLSSLSDLGFTSEFLITVLLYLLFIVIFQLLIAPVYVFCLKLQSKTKKRYGKPAYTPSAVMEFYDEFFTETAADQKTELKYTAIKRISITEKK